MLSRLIHLINSGVDFAKPDGLLLIDDDTCLVGSANFDHRSFRLNFELSVLLHDEAIAGRLEAQVKEDLGHCREVRPDQPASGFGRRLGEACARLFSPLL